MRTPPVVVGCLFAAACGGPPGPALGPDPDPEGPSDVLIEPLEACAEPIAGFTRLEPGAVDRGLEVVDPGDTTPRSCLWVPGGVVASDLDDDGDPDLLFVRPDEFPSIHRNEAGQLLEVDLGVPGTTEVLGRMTLGAAAVDLDGDALPEILLVGEGFAAVSANLGDLRFETPQAILMQVDYPVTCFSTLAVGDVDGDGDLDLALPGLDPVASPGALPESQVPDGGTWDLLLLNDSGVFEPTAELGPVGGPWLSMLAAFTDRDADGDLDLFVLPDRGRDGRPGAAFWRNDGPGPDGAPTLVNDAEALSADIHPCAMGMASADFDRDGRIDYCVSDLLSELRCLVGGPDDGYVEAGAALGLVAHPDGAPGWDPVDDQWSPWSLEAVDLDCDGHLDLAAAAGQPPGAGGVADTFVGTVQPDALWQGTAEGFEDRTFEVGFGDSRAHYGLVQADLDVDGYPELIVGAWDGPAVLWNNPCGPNRSLTIRLDGPSGNRQGFGARVEVEVEPGEVVVREVLGPRTVGQSPPEIHLGLAERPSVARIVVRWPDGEVTEARAVPSGSRVTIRHPER